MMDGVGVCCGEGFGAGEGGAEVVPFVGVEVSCTP